MFTELTPREKALGLLAAVLLAPLAYGLIILFLSIGG